MQDYRISSNYSRAFEKLISKFAVDLLLVWILDFGVTMLIREFCKEFVYRISSSYIKKIEFLAAVERSVENYHTNFVFDLLDNDFFGFRSFHFIHCSTWI